MDKYYNEHGEVGVIISPGFGAGWSTWNDNSEQLLFDKQLVEAVLADDIEAIKTRAQELVPDYVCLLAVQDLQVVFVDKGEHFRIEEYDGAEDLVTYHPGLYYIA